MENLLPKLVFLLTYWISTTVRFRVKGEAPVSRLRENDERIIYTIWHGLHLPGYHVFPSENVYAMVSPSRDGRRIAALLKMAGYSIIHGSSDKSPAKTLINSIHCIQNGGDMLVTVDGPRGPALKSKPGALYIAKKTEAWITPVTFGVNRKIHLKSWDRFMVPLPFSKVVMLYGTPYKLDSKLNSEQIDQACLELDRILNQLTARADRYINIDTK